MKEWMYIFIIIFVLFCMQSIGGMFQVKDFRKAIRRVHQYGNVGIGQKKGFLFSGYLVLIACDSQGIITYAEALDGAFIFSKFHPIHTYLGMELVGASIYDFIEKFPLMEKKEWKKNKGYIQALEALGNRLNQVPEEETEEAEESTQASEN